MYCMDILDEAPCPKRKAIADTEGHPTLWTWMPSQRVKIQIWQSDCEWILRNQSINQWSANFVLVESKKRRNAYCEDDAQNVERRRNAQ